MSDLRDKITIIPQIPTLFKGTIRFNLDPDERCSDEEIVGLLRRANISKTLDYMIEDKGENLSSGEKQLICICWAILLVLPCFWNRLNEKEWEEKEV